jgi:prevent-host-death family protein
MAREVSVRELRNHTAEVVAAVRSGERIALTVNRVAVADIVPHLERRSPWLPAAELRRILEDTPADPDLLADLAEVRDAVVDEL